MDEYLFIQSAKLQADRRRLARLEAAPVDMGLEASPADRRRGQERSLRAQKPVATEHANVRKPREASRFLRAAPRVFQLPRVFHWRA